VLKLLPRYLFVTLLLLAFLSHSISQKEDPSNYHSLSEEYRAAQHLYDEATALSDADAEEKESAFNGQALQKFQLLENRLPTRPLYDSLRFFTSFRVGELQHYFEHFQQALDAYTRAINIKLKSELPDSLLFRPYLFSGIIYYNQNKYDSAAISFRQAEKIQSGYHYQLEESERLYNTFGVLYYEKGDYLQARNYFSKALETLSPAHPYHRSLYLNYKVNLAQIYFKLEDYDHANAIYQELLALHPANTSDIYHNLGLINLYLGAPAKALEYFRRVTDRSSNKIIWLYRNIGEAFINLGQPDSARKFFSMAAAAHLALGENTDHNAYGQTLKSQGDLLAGVSPFEALHYYQQSLHEFYPAYNDTLVASNPHVFTGAFSYIELFGALTAKAGAYHQLYINTKNINYGKEELNAYQSAFALLDYVERTYNSDEARLFLEKTKHLVHAKPIDLAYELYTKTGDRKFLEALYVFDQQNKASVLAIKSQVTQQLSGKDANLLAKERDTRSTITRLSLRAMHSSDSGEVARLNAQIRDYEIRLEPLQQKLSGGSYTQGIPSVPSLQQIILDDNTALISFHLSKEKLTSTIITKDSFWCSQQPLPPDFTHKIQDYLHALKNEAGLSTIGASSKMLFELLLRQVPVKNALRLVIIPDEELNYLSFESLMDKDGHYLIENHSVQYQYSTALLKKESIDLRSHETLSFAPFATASDDSLHLGKLPNSFDEINNLRGKRELDAAATKRSFLQQVQAYPVIHLATHAIINENDDNLSYISFYPGQHQNSDSFLLYTKEVYNLPLEKTKLVILSACETGSGNLVTGEGMMSFSRAFAYAGCSNIIASLWNASDFSTAWLTRRIHFYLDKNYAIDKAIRQAKLDYLSDKTISPRLKHPFYWSNLVFVGNITVPGEKNYAWLIGLAASLALLGLLLWLRMKKTYGRGGSS
jgi:tetratricopeptide (TPR) repeat protein